MSSVQEAVLNLLPELSKPKTLEKSVSPPEKDLVVKAKTGTGKTLAFLVPAMESRVRCLEAESAMLPPKTDKVERIRFARHAAKTSAGALIISPTRELASQIAQEAVKLCYNLKDFQTMLFVGGANKSIQLRQWMMGRPDIVVATPGRLCDLLQSEPSIRESLGRCKTFILDEADTLLEMGFKDELERIISYLPPKPQRQTFLFSATIADDVKRIALENVRPGYKFIDTVPANESNVHDHVPQYVTVLPSPELQLLHIYRLLFRDAICHPQGGKAVIFFPTTRSTELFAEILRRMAPLLPFGRDTLVLEISSGKTQSARDSVARRFRQHRGSYAILCTTDVSARGVDYPGVTSVIQVGVSSTRDVYIHRVGRTGRAGASGRGDLVLLSWEKSYIQGPLSTLPLRPLTVTDVEAQLEELVTEHESASVPSRLPKSLRPILDAAPSALEDRVTQSIGEQLVAGAFSSMLGFYSGRELKCTKVQIIEGLKSWAMAVGGLEEPPHVSAATLDRCGFGAVNRAPTGRFGSAVPRTRSPSSGGSGQAFRGGYASANSGGYASPVSPYASPPRPAHSLRYSSPASRSASPSSRYASPSRGGYDGGSRTGMSDRRSFERRSSERFSFDRSASRPRPWSGRGRTSSRR